MLLRNVNSRSLARSDTKMRVSCSCCSVFLLLLLVAMCASVRLAVLLILLLIFMLCLMKVAGLCSIRHCVCFVLLAVCCSSSSSSYLHIVFDESGQFVLYPTLLGVKVVNMVTNKLVRVIGKVSVMMMMMMMMMQSLPTLCCC